MRLNMQYPLVTTDDLPVLEAIGAAARGDDLIDTLDGIAAMAVSGFGVIGGGIYLWSDGRLHLVGGADGPTLLPEALQRLTVDGPCLESCRSGRIAVGVLPFVGGDPSLRVAALPIAFRGEMLGSFGLLSHESLPDALIARARAYADVAAMVVVSGDPAPDAIARLRTLRAAIDGRTLIEQATGMLLERFECDARTARERLRSAAAAIGVGMVVVAREVVDRQLDPRISEMLNPSD